MLCDGNAVGQFSISSFWCAGLMVTCNPCGVDVESAGEPVGQRNPSDWLVSWANQCTSRETYKLFWALAVVIAVCSSAAFWLRHRWREGDSTVCLFSCQFSVSGHKDASASWLLSVSWWKGCIYGLFCKTIKSRRQEVTWTQQQEGVCPPHNSNKKKKKLN